MIVYYGLVTLIVLGLVALAIMYFFMHFRNQESWRDYEFHCAEYWEKKGYKTKVYGGSGDGGIDVKAWKGKEKRVIQCKQFKSNKSKVGSLHVKDIAATAVYVSNDSKPPYKACIMTYNGKLTEQARQLANGLDVLIIEYK